MNIEKTNKIVYWISTGLLSIMMMMSAGFYFFNNQMACDMFEKLAYPAYLVLPLGIAKIAGLLAIWMRFSVRLTQWAYAGFFFDFTLALAAHLMAGDGAFIMPIVAIILLMVSFVFGNRFYQPISKGK